MTHDKRRPYIQDVSAHADPELAYGDLSISMCNQTSNLINAVMAGIAIQTRFGSSASSLVGDTMAINYNRSGSGSSSNSSSRRENFARPTENRQQRFNRETTAILEQCTSVSTCRLSSPSTN